jgi:hypothetical protein
MSAIARWTTRATRKVRQHLTGGPQPDVHANTDRGFDRVVRAEEAGLGAGLDQAEEGRLGVTDEEKEIVRAASPKARKRRP